MELTSSKMKRRTVTCVATLTAAGLSLGVVACGGSGSDAEASDAAAGGEMPAGPPPQLK
ncbi:MAG: hypothetical protein JJE13_05155 [Thermoleophilia bacterium]|nr:hypothetical protein [Thermoleophilia bacterium]